MAGFCFLDKEIMTESVKYLLDESRMPKSWYNLVADLPTPPPPVLHPGTLQPIGPDDLAPLFPRSLIQQEVSTEREIEIPEPVRDIYRQWRPTPLYRARRLEKALGTPARIYYKYEGVSPAGSHKPNTAVAQAFYNREAGIKRIATETGAGQWGSSLAFAGALFGIEVQVFMVRVSYQQKPYRRALMETYGARCVASPSEETACGRAILAQRPDHPGSLGIAISEAVEVAAQRDDTKYALGSVLNHVLLHQTVVGLESMAQLEMAGDYPDVIVACTGGGSNFAGIAFPFIGAQLRGGQRVRIVAIEPAACPTLTRGPYAYDFGDTAHLTPLTKMHTLGSTFTPPGFHAGGLRYHGMAPLVSHVKELGLIEARAYHQLSCFEAGVLFARVEGILPAPEANHAVKGAIDEALRCKEEGISRAILFNLCGHGHFDMQAYMDYFAGKLTDQSYDEAELAMALSGLPSVTAA
ncbi:Tryptophan synthase beta chain 2 [Candidatus Contendobacter odensis Run_B_J11]|uniref:Tryptophan synthase beta chain n=2 Tax=Candidatus Contendibacter odensensis TaxID=1400860 RepID=A0A7U7G9P2_9GAMM|nr:Tryptophan synthase beta chain 2 [Candidatus Contendobacter odensis Run_B_J11]